MINNCFVCSQEWIGLEMRSEKRKREFMSNIELIVCSNCSRSSSQTRFHWCMTENSAFVDSASDRADNVTIVNNISLSPHSLFSQLDFNFEIQFYKHELITERMERSAQVNRAILLQYEEKKIYEIEIIQTGLLQRSRSDLTTKEYATLIINFRVAASVTWTMFKLIWLARFPDLLKLKSQQNKKVLLAD